MASLIGTDIHQWLQQIQDLATQCSKDLQTVPTPECEHEGRLAHVNAQLEEALERYATQSATDQSDLRKKIVGYICELEQLEASYMARREDAEVAYNDKTKPAKKTLQRQHIQFKAMELDLAGVNGTKQQI
ncbi:hypothetical protein PLIIFM63780_002191 [Purpureocillium lilacinum]|nr:hypothetical protein PLIIFM63780_002191 [Purpureocillium lilacinum]